MNIISSLNIKQIFINNTKNGIQRFDYPIGAYIHACSTTTNTQVEKFNKFIGYLDELETKQKIQSVRYPAYHQ
jgi:hypothetical protein